MIGKSAPQLEGLPTEHLGALGPRPSDKLRGQPRFAEAGFAYQQHDLRLSLPRLLVAADQLAEGCGPSDERGHQFAGRLASGHNGGGAGSGVHLTTSCGGANAFSQGHGLRRGLDPQLLG